MTDRAATGRAAERRARRHLERAGLVLRHANYRTRRGELDLVMETGDGGIVFVEVRYRAGSDYGGGVASVDHGKRRRLVQAARYYLSEQRLHQRAARFDVVAIDGNNRLDWITNAFDEGE